MLAWKTKCFAFSVNKRQEGQAALAVPAFAEKLRKPRLQDELTGALITLAHHAKAQQAENLVIDQLLIEGLFTTLTNVNFDDSVIGRLLDTVHAETAKLQAAAVDYDMKKYLGG